MKLTPRQRRALAAVRGGDPFHGATARPARRQTLNVLARRFYVYQMGEVGRLTRLGERELGPQRGR
jgi:hypothetical protein